MQFDDAKQKMSALRASLNNDVKQICGDVRLSDQGRKHELAKTLLTHRRQAEQYRGSFSADNEQVRKSLTSKLFGIQKDAGPSAVIAERDAQDRAAKLGSADDAASMLVRAQDLGDDSLAKAVAAHAHSRGWHDVTERYAAATGVAGDLDELHQLPSGAQLGLAVTALFAVPAPTELNQAIGGPIDDARLQRLADEPPPTPRRHVAL
jgi:hypothetical protein